MKQKSTPSTTTDKSKKLSKKLLKIAQDEAERQLLLFKKEEFISSKGKDSSLELLTDKITLMNNVQLSISGLNKYVSQQKAEYKPIFTLEFYQEIFRLKGWDMEKAKDYTKPKEVADYTNNFVYGRFPKEVLPVIQWKNPYDQYIKRKDKHYQHLTEWGRGKAEQFIYDCIEIMKDSNTWHEFTVKYATKYGFPFQLSLFDKNTPD